MLPESVFQYLRILCDAENIPERLELAQLIAPAKDHMNAIVEADVDPHHSSEICLAAVDVLVSTLASEAGNLALKVLERRAECTRQKVLAQRIIPELESPAEPVLNHDSSKNTLIRNHRKLKEQQ